MAHQCKECPRSFETPRGLSVHVGHAHGNQVGGSCCGITFTYLGLAVHQKQMHTKWFTPRPCARCKKLIEIPAFQVQKYHPRCQPISKYGISRGDLEDMFIAQDGRCQICRQKGILSLRGLQQQQARGNRSGVGRPHANILRIDHDHATGKVRGLLCLPCNRNLAGALELFGPTKVSAAMKYLEW